MTGTRLSRRHGTERITSVKRDAIITVPREFAVNAGKTNGRSMIIIGAGKNN